ARDVSAAARPEQGSLCGNDEPLLHCRQRDQGGALVAARETGTNGLDIDGHLPSRHSLRGLAGLAASRKAGPTSALSGLLRIASPNGTKTILGRRVGPRLIADRSHRADCSNFLLYPA